MPHKRKPKFPHRAKSPMATKLSERLPHNAIGEVTPSAYQAFLNAVHQGTFN
jgi:hypothetical protein